MLCIAIIYQSDFCTKISFGVNTGKWAIVRENKREVTLHIKGVFYSVCRIFFCSVCIRLHTEQYKFKTKTLLLLSVTLISKFRRTFMENSEYWTKQCKSTMMWLKELLSCNKRSGSPLCQKSARVKFWVKKTTQNFRQIHAANKCWNQYFS